MCGICGRVSFQEQEADDVTFLVDQMMHLMEHRGPDDSGIWNGPHATLGHKRLSIIDLSPAGRQPMVSQDGKKVLVFNGEIYNFLEIKKQFSSEISFRFHNDSETILKLYERFGYHCLGYLRGMFAFAIWDAGEQQLFFARDRAGKKPFFYSLQNGNFIFASEMRALLVNPDFSFQIDEESIYHYLTLQYIPAPRTIFKNVFKLPAGHFGIFKNGNLAIQRYWQLQHQPHKWSEEEALRRLEELLRESVRLRMISDVPLGAFLSGGLDSSAVVCLMSELSDRPVKTFHIRFDEKKFDEAEYATAVASHFGTDHHELTVKPDFVDVLPKIIWHYSEPFADSSAVPFFYLSQMTRQYVKVALSGDGGDELFGGYPRYRFSLSGNRNSIIGHFAQQVRRIPRNMRYVSRLRSFFEEHQQSLPAIYLEKICYFQESEKRALFLPEFAQRTRDYSTFQWLAGWMDQFEGVPFPENLMAVDIQTYLPDDLLVKADVASMACSLEARSPLLDHELMEFAASLPTDLKIRGRISKYILKKFLRGKLPDQILERPKMGFGVPLSVWFRKDLRNFLRDVLLSPSATGRGYFSEKAVQKLIDAHVSGLFDHSYKLYCLLVLELWLRIFIDERHRVLSASTFTETQRVTSRA